MAVAQAPSVVPFVPTHFYRCQHCKARMRSSSEFEEYQHAGCGGLVKLEPPPPPTALDDAKIFLDRHPWATTDADNPVDLLRALVAEVDVEEDGAAEAEVGESDAPARVEKLVAFIRKLRDAEKISESEYREAMKVVAD